MFPPHGGTAVIAALMGTCQDRGSAAGWTTQSNRACPSFLGNRFSNCLKPIAGHPWGHSSRGTCPLQGIKEHNGIWLPAKSRPLNALGCSTWTLFSLYDTSSASLDNPVSSPCSWQGLSLDLLYELYHIVSFKKPSLTRQN